MPLPATRADSLRILSGGSEVQHLSAVRTIAGVKPLLAAARCGPGIALLRSRGGSELSFSAPGGSWGPWVSTPADGDYLLEDGADPNKFLRVEVYATYLWTFSEYGRVHLADRFQNGVGHDDVTAGEASAGDVADFTLTLRNDSTVGLSRVVAWLDATVSDLEISDDDITYVAPTSEATGLALADIPPGASITLYLRRTIAAASPSDADILNFLHLAFDGL